MKTLIIALLFNIQLVDFKTNEPITGAKVATEQHIYYSDFNGIVNIPKNEKIINISFVSYNDEIVNFNACDTIIKLKSL